MFSKLSKKVIWLILLWFAGLQAIAPLMHAHSDSNTSQQGYGIHIHFDELVQVQDKHTTLRHNLSVSNTIGMDKAIVKVVKVLPPPLFVFLFLIYVFVVLSKRFSSITIFPQCPTPYLRSASRPRAPPLS